MSNTIKKTCAAIGCNTPRRPDEVFCREHWFRLPKPLRDQIWNKCKADRRGVTHLSAIGDAMRYLRNEEKS